MTYTTDLESEKHGQELATVTNQHAVTDRGQLLLHCILNRNWSNILTPGRYQQFCSRTIMLILFKTLNVFQIRTHTDAVGRAAAMASGL